NETIPYILHANAGLQTLTYSKGAESLTDSLKVLQYTYCGLPVVAPTFLNSERRNMCYYEVGDARSIASALQEALEFAPEPAAEHRVNSWSEVLSAILSDRAIGLSE